MSPSPQCTADPLRSGPIGTSGEAARQRGQRQTSHWTSAFPCAWPGRSRLKRKWELAGDQHLPYEPDPRREAQGPECTSGHGSHAPAVVSRLPERC